MGSKIEDPNKNNELIEVLGYNLALEDKYGGQRRMPLIREVLRSSEAHIMMFQEVAYNYVDALRKTRKKFNWEFGEQSGDLMLNPIGYSANRFTRIESWTIGLSPSKRIAPAWEAKTPRAATFLALRDTKVNKDVLVVNFHLDNISTKARILGVKLIQKEIRRYVKAAKKDVSIIIGGDMNTNPNSPQDRWHTPEFRAPYIYLTDRYQDGWCQGNKDNAQRPMSYHSFKGRGYKGDGFGTYDPDFYGCNDKFTVVNCSLITYEMAGVHASDHYGYCLLLRHNDERNQS